MNQYEAMFLFDPTSGSSFESCEAEIRRILGRAEAEILLCRKWDERRLAFKVKGRKRGVYVLTYFKAAPEKITGLERDAQLSEHVLRVLIVRADGLTAEHMEKAFQVRPAEGDRPEGGEGEGDFGGRGERSRDHGRGGFERRGPRSHGPRRESVETTAAAPAESPSTE